MEAAEMRMQRFSLGVTRKDKIGNEHIRGTLKVGRFGHKVGESRLRWHGELCETLRSCGQERAGDAAAREKKTGKIKEPRTYGCGEGGHAGGRSERR